MKKILLGAFAVLVFVGTNAFAEDVSSPEAQCKDKKDQYDKCLEAAKKKADERTLICQPGDFKCLSLKWEKLRKANRTNAKAIDGVKRQVGQKADQVDLNATNKRLEEIANTQVKETNALTNLQNQVGNNEGRLHEQERKLTNELMNSAEERKRLSTGNKVAIGVGVGAGVTAIVAIIVGSWAATHPPTYYQNAVPR